MKAYDRPELYCSECNSMLSLWRKTESGLPEYEHGWNPVIPCSMTGKRFKAHISEYELEEIPETKPKEPT